MAEEGGVRRRRQRIFVDLMLQTQEKLRPGCHVNYDVVRFINTAMTRPFLKRSMNSLFLFGHRSRLEFLSQIRKQGRYWSEWGI